MVSRGQDTNASAPASPKAGKEQSMLDAFLGSKSTRTPAKSTRTPYQILRSCAADSHARRSQTPECEGDWPTPEVISALRSLGLLRPGSHNICFSKTSPVFSITKTGKRTKPSSPRWMMWGMMSRGKSWTGRIGYRSNASVSSLSELLEEVVPRKYYLSRRAKEQLIRRDAEKRERKMGGGARVLSRL